MSSLALSTKTIDSFGVDRFVIGRFLLQGESEPIPFTFTVGSTGLPLDLTSYTITFRLRKQIVGSAKDTKNGYECVDREDDPDSAELDLDSMVEMVDAANGQILVSIPQSVTTEGANEFDVPTILTGFITVEDNASHGELIQKFPIFVAVK